MSKQSLFLPIAVIGILLTYNIVRWKVQDTTQQLPLPTYQVELSTLPKEVKPGQVFLVSWNVRAPQSTGIKNTAIFYGQTSTPSAVRQTDAPAALGYANQTLDYSNGDFSVPGDFSTRITAPQSGKIYLRGFAYVDGRNIWTDEKVVKVQ